MAKHALFLSSICHVLLVISDTMMDMQTTHFVRSIYSLRQSIKINTFLRHDSSLRRKLKNLQIKINERNDKKKSSNLNNLKSSNIDNQPWRTNNNNSENVKRYTMTI